MKYTIFLTLEPYLAQWLRHQSGGEYPIQIRRGSTEAEFLEYFLKPQPKREDYIPQTKEEEGQVTIVLPCFKYKDVRTYNYLPPRGAMCLHACIKNRFKVQLWKDVYRTDFVNNRIDLLLIKWMEEHGIEVDDRNYNTLAKILQRVRIANSPNGFIRTNKSTKPKNNEENP